jgi:hypothetical protein
VAVFAAALFKDREGPVLYLAVCAGFWRSGGPDGGGIRHSGSLDVADFGQSGVNGRGLRRGDDSFIQLWLFLDFGFDH